MSTAPACLPVRSRRAPGPVPFDAPHEPPPFDPDPLLVYALRAILVSERARRLAWHLGPDLFEDPAARMLAACFITGRLPDSPGGRYRREVERLMAEVTASTVPPAGDPEWAVHLVRELARQRHLPILADTLAWAHTAVLTRTPLAFVLRRVIWAFAAAMGARPLDAALHPGGREEWA